MVGYSTKIPLYNDDNSLKGFQYRDEYGIVHRENGPAYEFINGTKKWLIHGMFHRLEGAAIIWNNGVKDWYITGSLIHKDFHPFNIFRNEYNLSEDYEEWSIEMKVLFKLSYDGITGEVE